MGRVYFFCSATHSKCRMEKALIRAGLASDRLRIVIFANPGLAKDGNE